MFFKKKIPTTFIPFFSLFSIFALAPFLVKAGWDDGINYVNDSKKVQLPGAGPLWIAFNALLWFFKIFVVLAIISFVVTGIIYLIAGMSGNSGLQERAKTGLTYSITATVIAFSGFLIIITVVMLLFPGSSLVDLAI